MIAFIVVVFVVFATSRDVVLPKAESDESINSLTQTKTLIISCVIP